MRRFDQAIVDFFTSHPESEFSTTDIVRAIFPEAEQLETTITNRVSNDTVRKAKHEKAVLHRRLLYYLNKLEEQGIIHAVSTGVNNEKTFALIAEGKPTPVRRPTPATPVEGYEQRGVLQKLDPATWTERFNSILLNAALFKSTRELTGLATACFNVVNDVIGITNTETLLSDRPNLIRGIQRLDARCDDYGKRLCVSFDISHGDAVAAIASELLATTKNTTLIITLDPKDLTLHNDALLTLVRDRLEHRGELLFHNKALHNPPYIIGRAGPYTFADNEWQRYEKNMAALICGQSTMLVDVERLLAEEPREQFTSFILKAAEALLLANTLQRRNSRELLDPLIKLNPENAYPFLVSRNVIRLWNYGWKNPATDQAQVVETLTAARKALDSYCPSEETIYKSCGMPTRFRVALSSCFDTAVRGTFSPASFKRLAFRNLQQLYDSPARDIITAKEKLFGIFDGGDIISFYREGSPEPEEALREIGFLLTTHRLELFRYSFTTTRAADLRLTDFT